MNTIPVSAVGTSPWCLPESCHHSEHRGDSQQPDIILNNTYNPWATTSSPLASKVLPSTHHLVDQNMKLDWTVRRLHDPAHCWLWHTPPLPSFPSLTRKHTCTHTRTHTCAWTHAHTRMNTHTHTHAHWSAYTFAHITCMVHPLNKITIFLIS